MPTRLLVPCSLLLALLFLAGCSERWCRDKYQLMKNEECKVDCDKCKKECFVQGPGGPDIGVGPVLNQLVWTVNGTAAIAGGSILAGNASSNANYCKLRDDFIGKALLNFDYTPTGLSPARAQIIELENATYLLRIKKTSGGAIDWWIKDKTAPAPGKQCTLTPLGSIPSSQEVPLEFTGFLTSDTFHEVVQGNNAQTIDLLKVQL